MIGGRDMQIIGLVETEDGLLESQLVSVDDINLTVSLKDKTIEVYAKDRKGDITLDVLEINDRTLGLKSPGRRILEDFIETIDLLKAISSRKGKNVITVYDFIDKFTEMCNREE